MPSTYVQSNDNRHYVVKEASPGSVPSIDGNHRVALSGLRMSTSHLVPRRSDKWGSRSAGAPLQTVQRDSAFQFSVYHYVNGQYPNASRYGALIEAGMGGDPLYFTGGTVESLPEMNQVRFMSPHALSRLMAVSHAGEIRFVNQVIDANTVELNAPFTVAPTSGNALAPALTYPLARTLKSFSLFDYWSPTSSVQRVGRGAVVEKMMVGINGDYHTLSFSGPMIDVVDSTTFEPGQGGLAAFPSEPSEAGIPHPMPVLGHLGQAYIGDSRYYTITEAEVTLTNGVDSKGREFGSVVPHSFVPGRRAVTFTAALYATDEAQTRAMYSHALARTPVPVMIQLGDRQGHLMGVYLPSVIPSVPGFDDRENRLIWRFDKCTAHGT